LPAGGDINAAERDVAGLDRQASAIDQQGRLARAISADQCNDRASGDLQRNIVDVRIAS
jgi:hypothetical protein